MSHLASTMATHLPLLFFNLPKRLVKFFRFADKKKIQLISKVKVFVDLNLNYPQISVFSMLLSLLLPFSRVNAP